MTYTVQFDYQQKDNPPALTGLSTEEVGKALMNAVVTNRATFFHISTADREEFPVKVPGLSQCLFFKDNMLAGPGNYVIVNRDTLVCVNTVQCFSYEFTCNVTITPEG